MGPNNDFRKMKPFQLYMNFQYVLLLSFAFGADRQLVNSVAYILRRQITRRCGPSSIAKMLPTRGEEEHVHSMSSMFLLKPTKHTYTPLSLTDKGPLKHRQREGMLRIYMPDRYRGIDSMVSHWECRRSLWEHPGREKAGSSQPPGGDARTIMT